MSGVALTGSLPGQISENSAPWDWIGQLRLNINPALINFVDLVGIGSNFFDVSLNRWSGVLTIAPIAYADHEWFVANNMSTTISFRLQFYMADGSIQYSQASYSVGLLNVDDTPPQALSFATGGLVAAGAAGANIGRLKVSDPDTAGDFTFTIREDDAWIFEVVGDMLKLRSGVSIPLADGPEREVVVTASDGVRSAAFVLPIGVTALGINNGGTVDLLESHESSYGFSWAGPGHMFSTRMRDEISTVRDFGALIHLQLRDGGSVTVEQPSEIDLLDGYMTFSGDGLAGRVWAIYETVFNREPGRDEMAAGAKRLAAAGTSNEVLVNDLLSSAEFAATYGQQGNAAFANQLYLNSVGWTSASGVAFHAGNLDRGASRAKVANDFVTWRLDSLNHADSRAANGGFFVPRSWVDTLDDVVPASPTPTSFALWLAEQVMGGRMDLHALSSMVQTAQGILPELRTGQSRIETLITDMTDHSAEASWAKSFAESLLKRGSNATQYLQDLIRTYDPEEIQRLAQPQGVDFQDGW